jgi:hypothetical protein
VDIDMRSPGWELRCWLILGGTRLMLRHPQNALTVGTLEK